MQLNDIADDFVRYALADFGNHHIENAGQAVKATDQNSGGVTTGTGLTETRVTYAKENPLIQAVNPEVNTALKNGIFATDRVILILGIKS